MFRLFRKKTAHRSVIIVGVVAAVVFLVIGYFAMDYFVRGLVLGETVSPAASFRPAPPTAYEYQRAAAQALQPLMGYLTVQNAPLPAGDAEAVRLINQAQQDLLKLRVPSEERDLHLQIILVLNKFRSAMSGTDADRVAAIEALARLRQAMGLSQ